MSTPSISPFSEGFATPASSIADVCNPGLSPSFSPFSESILVPKEPPDVKRAFTNLRKAWMESHSILPTDKKPPTAGEVKNAWQTLDKWRKTLTEAKELDPEMGRRVEAAMKTARAYKPPLKASSVAKMAKAEKIVKAIAEESGKKLAAKTVARYALKVIPYLGTALMFFPDVMDWLRSSKQAPETRKFIADLMTESKERPKFSELNPARFHPRIPGGANYHPSVGWY